jgi:bacteriocin-like protein
MTTSNHVHELANQANELTEDELNHVSGGIIAVLIGLSSDAEILTTAPINGHVK